MKKLLGIALLPAWLFAAVEGVVINQTTGKPQPGATVTLIRLGQGMDTVASTKSDAQGKFRIEQDLQAAAPHLIQALHQDITYNTQLRPGSSGTGLELAVYDSARQVPEAKVTRHLIALQPSGGELAVNEILVVTNTSTTTLRPDSGAIRFFIPPQVTAPVRVSVQGPQGMPLQRPSEKTSEANVFTVGFPIRPGESRIDYSYTMPLKEPVTFTAKALHDGPVQLLTPRGVAIAGEGATKLGEDERIPGTIYQIASRDISLTIQGTGTFRDPQQQGSGEESAAAGEEGPGIEQAKPRVYKRLPAILALALTMMAIGFVLLYRSGDGPKVRTSSKRV
ncbi:MAG TPA: carboxypeptidase-like regulatory domain-containing protein [Bryobacteraceae bacterium]|nr:carboxypeptidase-like regulatory domain-containing protein [Bryobacteraceae bacterium]